MGGIINCIQTDFADTDTCATAEEVKKNVNIWLFMPILLVIYVPLVMIRDMRRLAWSHLLSNILVGSVIISIIIINITKIANHGATFNPPVGAEWYSSPSWAAGSFEGVAVLMPMRLIVQDQRNFYKHVALVCICVLSMYIFFDELANAAVGDFS